MRIFVKAGVLLAILMSLATSTGATGFYFSEGDRDRDLVTIHAKLRQAGFRMATDGELFSIGTEQAVKAFQKAHKLPVTGVIEEKTYQLLLDKPMQEDKGSTVRVRALASTAFTYLASPYRYGGTTPQGFDCSGFVQFVYARHGLKLPRSADTQYTAGNKIARKQLRAGDLVFFSTTEPGASHSGIYLGDNKFISATSSRGVAIRSMDDSYWKTRYWGACRVL